MSERPNEPQHDAVNVDIKQLHLQFKQILPERVVQILGLWKRLCHLDWNRDALVVLLRSVHSLAGSSKTYGYRRIGELASLLELALQQIIENGNAPDESQRQRVDAYFAEINQAISQSGTAPAVAVVDSVVRTHDQASGRSEKLIYVIDDDVFVARFIAAQLDVAGYSTRLFESLASARAAAAHDHPVVFVLDIMFPEGNLAGIEAVDDLRAAAGSRTPVVFISNRVDVAARLRAVRAGGDAYFAKPVDIEQLIQQLDALTAINRVEAYRVLIVEDDASQSQLLATVLRETGLVVREINRPEMALEAVSDFAPDVMLLDMNMPGVNGCELAQVIRQERHVAGLPIIFMTAETHPDIETSALAAGGDEFLVKPLDFSVLIALVQKHARKARTLVHQFRAMTRIDSATGLFNRPYFLSLLERSVATATDGSELQALLFVTVDNVEAVRSHWGIGHIDEFLRQLAGAIRQSLASDDCACHFSETTFAILTKVRTQEANNKLANAVRDAVQKSAPSVAGKSIPISCSIGLTLLRDSTASVATVLDEAESLANHAATLGGNQVQHSEDRPGKSAQPSELTERVRDAIEHNAMVLAYQPILVIGDDSEEMFETLVRIKDRDGKILLPSQFMPVLSKINKINEMDRWVVEHSISALVSNERAQRRATFFVKVSGESLAHSSFLPWLSNCLRSSRVRGENRIMIQLREADILNRTRETKLLVDSLRKLRFGIAVDHLILNSASFALLSEIKPEFVKIQGDFVNRLSIDAALRDKVRRLIVELKKRDVGVIFGNIEDPNSIQILFEWGVRYFQGYAIQRPSEVLNFDIDRLEMVAK